MTLLESHSSSYLKIMQVRKLQKTEYPFLLKQISRLPETMDIVGDLPADDHKFLCVIGSRTHSSYGLDACKKLIRGLKGYPVVIVSGLAIGIDSAAHEAALDAGLKTVSFPGSGLSPTAIYPPSRRELARRIIESGGALVSPFPYTFRGDRWTFPNRNRLMAGISHAILIIEGRKGSGTLGTADFATEFNRDILAVPGNILSDLSYGPHMLIRNGATPITCSEDILEALGFDIRNNDGSYHNVADLHQLSLSKEERSIIEWLIREPMSSTDLIQKTSFPASQFNTIVTELELRGLVKEKEGRYRLAH